ncbi:MAG: helix-turn-helix domain-containing protein [Conexivisphaerales archaeon]
MIQYTTPNGNGNKTVSDGIDDACIHKLVTDLTLYGLTPNQAKLYLHLLRNRISGAKEISRALNIHRVDVYRRLRELEELGIVEVYLDFPKKFVAVNPRATLESLVQRVKSRLNQLEGARADLQRRLDKVEKSAQIYNPANIPLNQENYYKFSRGTTQYFTELARLLKNAKQEILKISSANGLHRAMATGLYKHYTRAHARGVKIRLITNILPENIHYAKMFAKVTELRHISDVYFRFTIADRLVVLLSTKYDDKIIIPGSGSDNYFLFNDPTFASALFFLFEHMWERADTLEDRLKELSLSSKSSQMGSTFS